MSNERQRIQADLELEELKDKAREWDILAKENLELRKEIERLNNIINEAIEYIQDRYNGEVLTHTFDKCNVGKLLEILDKESDKE